MTQKTVFKLVQSFALKLITTLAAAFVFQSAQAAVVTIEGTIDKVVPEKTEIYVLADGKKHEFYFTPKTEIVKAGKPANFDMLKASGKVKITADKIGKRLDPLKVEILD